jgi:hypothetical protein
MYNLINSINYNYMIKKAGIIILLLFLLIIVSKFIQINLYCNPMCSRENPPCQKGIIGCGKFVCMMSCSNMQHGPCININGENWCFGLWQFLDINRNNY